MTKSLSHILSRLGACLMVALLFVACKPGVPKKYIQPGKMERILFDYHLADGMAYVNGRYDETTLLRAEYRKAVFLIHGITEAQFDSSLVYYYRHSDKLHDIYANVAKRLENEAAAIGSPTMGESSVFSHLSANGDTAVVWNMVSSAVIMPYVPYNVVSFSLDADTAFHKGDRVILSFNANFIFQEGSRDAVALLSVTYDNDSVASQTLHLYSDTRYTLQLDDYKKAGIKKVKGFIGMMKGQNNDSETLKLMILNQIAVYRVHEKVVVEAETDSSSIAPTADTAVHVAQPQGPPRRVSDKPVIIPPRSLKEKIAADQEARTSGKQ